MGPKKSAIPEWDESFDPFTVRITNGLQLKLEVLHHELLSLTGGFPLGKGAFCMSRYQLKQLATSAPRDVWLVLKRGKGVPRLVDEDKTPKRAQRYSLSPSQLSATLSSASHQSQRFRLPEPLHANRDKTAKEAQR